MAARPKSRLSALDREARSRLLHILHYVPVLHASLVTMARTCGNPTCKCASGEKHVSLYASTFVGKKRKMVYIPAALETQVREWARDYQEVCECLERISGECVKRLMKAKEDVSAGRTPRA